MRIVERKRSILSGASDLHQIVLEQDGIYYLLEGRENGSTLFLSIHTKKPYIDGYEDIGTQVRRWSNDCTLYKDVSDKWVKRVDYYPEAFMAELIL